MGGQSRVPRDPAVYMEIKSLAADCLSELQITSPLWLACTLSLSPSHTHTHFNLMPIPHHSIPPSIHRSINQSVSQSFEWLCCDPWREGMMGNARDQFPGYLCDRFTMFSANWMSYALNGSNLLGFTWPLIKQASEWGGIVGSPQYMHTSSRSFNAKAMNLACIPEITRFFFLPVVLRIMYQSSALGCL